MRSKPRFWLIAGPNGAGKSTIVGSHGVSLGRLIRRVAFINPDEIARQFLIQRGFKGFHDAPLAVQKETFIEAALVVEKRVDEAIDRRKTIGVETVLSTAKYRPFVERVLKACGDFGLIYVALRTPKLATERVARRVASGGHDVPATKIAERWRRSLENLPWFLGRATYSFVFDNSNSAELPPLLLARGHHGQFDVNLDAAFPELREALGAVSGK